MNKKIRDKTKLAEICCLHSGAKTIAKSVAYILERSKITLQKDSTLIV